MHVAGVGFYAVVGGTGGVCRWGRGEEGNYYAVEVGESRGVERGVTGYVSLDWVCTDLQ